jgi:hypothetical protein
MPFPTSPIDGQIATVNNIRYVYADASSSWTRLLGTKYVAAASAPSNPNLGDQWYNTGVDALYEYISDGVSSYWVDMSSEGVGNISLVGDSTLQGNLAPGVDARYSIGSPTGYLRNIYANTAVANIANIATANISTATVTGTANVGNLITAGGLFWANGASAIGPIYNNDSVAAYLPSFAGTLGAATIVNTGNLTVGGNIVQQRAYYETFGNLSNNGGNLVCNFNNGTIFNVTGMNANVTASFENVSTITNTATGAVVLIAQGATSFRVANIQVNGFNTNVRWINGTGTGVAPTGGTNCTDVLSFSMLYLGFNNWTVFGQLSSFA